MTARKQKKPGQRRTGTKPLRPTKEQARAWLASVLVPLSSELDTTAEFLEHGSWSFRCGRQDFEFLQPTAKMLAPRFRPNFEQLCRFHPEFETVAAEHDAALAQLRQACQAAYARLVEAEPFQQLAAGQQPSEHKYLAEYTVNGVKELDPTYTLHNFWAERGKEFLALRQHPELAAYFARLDEAGSQYRQRHEALREAVDKLQEQLADSFGLPPVDPVGEVVL
jgi:hypothetical protein